MAVIYDQPSALDIPLRRAPHPAVRDLADTAGQTALSAFLIDTFRTITRTVVQAPEPGDAAMELLIGATTPDDPSVPLVEYLQPLAATLEQSQSPGRRPIPIAAFHVRRTDAPAAHVVFGPAAAESGPAAAGATVDRWRTAASADAPAFVADLAAQAVRRDPPAAGPLRVDLSFAITRQLHWHTLWSPTLQALGALLDDPGSPSGAAGPGPKRIAHLGLHLDLQDGWSDETVVDVRIAPAG